MGIGKTMWGGAKSSGRAFYSGLNAGVGKFGVPKGIMPHVLSGAAIGGAIGSGLAASASNGAVDPLTAGAVGAGIGVATLPVAGFAMGAVGTAGVKLAKATPALAKGIGSGAIAAAPFVAGTAAIAADSLASKVWNVGSRMINWDAGADSFDKVKFAGPLTGIKAGWKNGRAFTDSVRNADGFLSKARAFAKNPTDNIRSLVGKSGNAVTGAIVNGATVIGAAALVGGTREAWGQLESAKMGQMTGTTGPAPRIPSYSNNAGATGDLVFALNANRRG